MKQSEFEKCAVCGDGMGASGQLFFYRVKIEQHILDTGAIQRQHGLEMSLGAAGPLAAVLGPDEDLSKGLGEKTVLVCGVCGLGSTLPVAALLD